MTQDPEAMSAPRAVARRTVTLFVLYFSSQFFSLPLVSCHFLGFLFWPFFVQQLESQWGLGSLPYLVLWAFNSVNILSSKGRKNMAKANGWLTGLERGRGGHMGKAIMWETVRFVHTGFNFQQESLLSHSCTGLVKTFFLILLNN